MTTTTTIKYSVKTFREAGLEAKWGRTRKGQPCIYLRWPQAPTQHQRERWVMCDNRMMTRMQRDGVVRGYDNSTVLVDLFFA